MAEPSSSSIAIDDVVDLAAIFEDHVNAATLRRPAQPCIARYAGAIARGGKLAFATATAFHPEEGGLEELDFLSRLLPPDDARDALVSDIAFCAEVLAELTGATSVGIRVAAMHAPMCPRYHVDRVGLRLVATYAGPGTQWLDEADVDRAAFPRGSAGDAERAVRRTATPYEARPFDVVILKGADFPESSRAGVLHRSPPCRGGASARLVLTIDALG